MQLKGRMTKSGKFWAVECPAIGAFTQGKNKREAYEMIVDWVQSMVGDPDYEVEVIPDSPRVFTLRVSDPKPILALMIAQTRHSSGLTHQEIATKMGSKSRSVVKTYESGAHDPSFTTAQKLLNAMGFDLEIRLVPRKA